MMMRPRAVRCRRSRPTCSRRSHTRGGCASWRCCATAIAPSPSCFPSWASSRRTCLSNWACCDGRGVVSATREGATVRYSIADPAIIELLAVARTFLINSLSVSQDLLADLSEHGR